MLVFPHGILANRATLARFFTAPDPFRNSTYERDLATFTDLLANPFVFS